MSRQDANGRKPLSKRVRFEVFKRDGFVCQYCGNHPPDVSLEVDHIQAVSRGGENDLDNLVTACFACNRGKSDIPLADIPLTMDARAALVAEREAQIAGFEAVMRARRERLDDDAHDVLDEFCRLYHRDGISHTQFGSIRTFVEKLGLDEVLEAVNIAHAKKPYSFQVSFKYFCGVCWRKIRRSEGTE